jgi:hypothetical protein
VGRLELTGLRLLLTGEAGEEDGAANGKEGEVGEMGSPSGAAGGGGQKKSPSKDKKLRRSIEGSGEGGADETTKESSSASAEGNYIDITDLLTLPQKEAAKKLGISESMLCKRFKECTRRKWPYRYVRCLARQTHASLSWSGQLISIFCGGRARVDTHTPVA